MNGEDKAYLDQRLTKLETIVEERWVSHNEVSLARHTENQQKFAELFTRLNALTCGKNIEQLKTMRHSINRLHTWFWGLVSTIVVGGFIIGLWIKMIG